MGTGYLASARAGVSLLEETFRSLTQGRLRERRIWVTEGCKLAGTGSHDANSRRNWVAQREIPSELGRLEVWESELGRLDDVRRSGATGRSALTSGFANCSLRRSPQELQNRPSSDFGGAKRPRAERFRIPATQFCSNHDREARFCRRRARRQPALFARVNPRALAHDDRGEVAGVLVGGVSKRGEDLLAG